MKVSWLGSALLLVAVAQLGCSKSDSPDTCSNCANQLVDQAGVALANGDYQAANAKYLAAVGNDPRNLRAQTGVALTGVYLIQNDPEVVRILNTTLPAPRPAPNLKSKPASFMRLLAANPGVDLGPDAMRARVLRAFSLAATDPVALSDVQNVIVTHVLPRLQDAENRLNLVEADPTFSYPVAVQVGGNLETLDVDLGEIYTLDALLNVVQGSLGMLAAYDFDVPHSDYASAPQDSLLAPGTSFGALHPTGAAQLSGALSNLLLVKVRFDQAAGSIAGETDDQSDDAIPKDVLTTQEYADFQTQVDRADHALRGPIAIELTDYLGSPFAAGVNISRIFVPAIADLKTKLPAHTFDSNHFLVVSDPLTFDDPTFNGIFPDMTNARWQALVGPVGPALAQR
jgi:hypothetical protein